MQPPVPMDAARDEIAVLDDCPLVVWFIGAEQGAQEIHDLRVDYEYGWGAMCLEWSLR